MWRLCGVNRKLETERNRRDYFLKTVMDEKNGTNIPKIKTTGGRETAGL